MGYRFSRGEVDYLGSPAGVAALAEVDRLSLTPKSSVRDTEQVRRAFGERTGALVETVRLRRRAVVKLPGAQHWLFDDDALQQATPATVARHRARRLAGRPVHDVTCSLGAELAALHRVCPAVLGSDLDEVRLAMAAHNLADAPNVLLARADALAPCSSGTVVIADPARRADGRRTYDPAKLQPPLPDLIDAYPGRELVVKCAPGIDFDSFLVRPGGGAPPGGLSWHGEVEVVSLDGSVREACLWPSGLGEPGVTRRASVLAGDGSGWSLTDAEPDDIPERAPGDWIVDPDGAVVRAGLVRHYAAKHGLWQLDPRIAYLTGNTVPDGVRGFHILDRFDFREKALRAELHRRDCGPLEILTRGVDLDPDALRARVKPRGGTPFTLVVTRIGATPTVFLCETPPVPR
ncbi:THUMP-like domain-containing protein [Nocardia sp. alder85J]|uniref:THUMP-like domain-containing protein n=1 Tax=Nocardia sp. alder85J TaxID=2862949 RepID=UPI001CD54EFF|nr:class I SAM-dependent methyltransferase [Nocardia sp. alder85J]MCX4095287.1 class I SAM-dependent methyltransferase [Nocardia sp. alder85J]